LKQLKHSSSEYIENSNNYEFGPIIKLDEIISNEDESVEKIENPKSSSKRVLTPRRFSNFEFNHIHSLSHSEREPALS
jgi:hypothetical protein